MERRQKILDGIDIARSTGLEFLGLRPPLVTKSQGEIYYVNYADIAYPTNRQALDNGGDRNGIVAVDFVWGTQCLDLVTNGRKFDYIVASHVLERVPDLITWLQELQSVLKPDGSIRLAVSDRRFTFECLRQNTRLAEVLDAWLRRARRPLPVSIFDSVLNAEEVDYQSACGVVPDSDRLRRRHSLEEALEWAREALLNEGSYDINCWTFTPSSLATLFEEMNRHDLVTLQPERFLPTEVGQMEFFVSLRTRRERRAAIESWRASRESCDRVSASCQSDTPTLGGRSTSAADERISALQMQVQNLNQTLVAFQMSTSWKVTAPMRSAATLTRHLKWVIKAARDSARFRGGVIPMLLYAMATIRREDWASKWARLRGHASVVVAAPTSGGQQALYDLWIAKQDVLDERAIEQDSESRGTGPLISILMPTYNTPLHLLERAIASVRAQVYPHWELCIADDCSTMPDVQQALQEARSSDPRIHIVCREVNGHISAASNSALKIATGEFVALLDHDDELHRMALYWIAREIDQFPDAALLYTDEDKFDDSGRRTDPYFKCDFNYELFLSHNMICHLGVYRRSLLTDLGGFRAGFDGAQDYDLALRLIERVQPEQIRHIPKVLYHWRVHDESTASGGKTKPYAFLAGQRAIAEHLKRMGMVGEVVEAPEIENMYRVRLAIPQPQPSVEIIIPTRDRADLVRMSVGSVLDNTAYSNYRICIVDNGSVELETLQLFEQWKRNPRIRIERDERRFNFSALNNLAVQSSQSTFVCLLNNDVEIISADWLSEMVSHANRANIGCVGARLWYPNQTLQHGGVILGLGGVAGHAHKHLPRGDPGYFGRAVLQQACSAVTAACLLVRRDIYLQVGGLDERLEIAFNDVDFCLRVTEAGYRNVWTPHAELFHHESLSRGYEDNPEKQARFLREIEFMKKRWSRRLTSDPYYSPNLTYDYENYSIAQV